ncbi:MAG: tRNA (adenosine(37)-N6)-threonylcarbamoyltransferase complex ATPase subunit type 1 TsaE [Chloroflexi bacterium]|nr:tRNA (adenosine(37)-N6)-threonylcarbamoyltransferase complex ATPase subunit type 1 TsaE [Chloroflexota bacterium]
MTGVLEFLSASPEETQQFGRLLGGQAHPGDVFLLTGGLGVGKTTLTQGIAWGLGVKERARSPTFVLVAEYQGRLPLYHMDLYRVNDVAEAMELGLEEYLQKAGVCVVEWAEKMPEAFPVDHLSIRIEHVDEMTRRLKIEAEGSRYEALLRAVGTMMKAEA